MRFTYIINYCLGMLVTLACQSQVKKPFVKLYAYYRESTPGILRGQIGTEQNQLLHPAPQKVYAWIFYAETTTNAPLSLQQLLIAGKPYGLTVDTLRDSQVIFQRTGIGDQVMYDTLVAPTGRTILRLTPTARISQSVDPAHLPSARLQYVYKRKKHTTPACRIRQLPPVILQ